MEIEKHEYVHIKMHRTEAERLLAMIEQIDSTMSNLPDWIKERSREFVTQFRKSGLGS